jgi:hypothetical protein
VEDDRADPDLCRLIDSLTDRSDGERSRLVQRLTDREWPGGADRTVPGAREWVRHWGPVRLPAERLLRACACSAGRCGVCN